MYVFKNHCDSEIFKIKRRIAFFFFFFFKVKYVSVNLSNETPLHILESTDTS
jgi:hypothetical protein